MESNYKIYNPIMISLANIIFSYKGPTTLFTLFSSFSPNLFQTLSTRGITRLRFISLSTKKLF